VQAGRQAATAASGRTDRRTGGATQKRSLRRQQAGGGTRLAAPKRITKKPLVTTPVGRPSVSRAGLNKSNWLKNDKYY